MTYGPWPGPSGHFAALSGNRSDARFCEKFS